jgi:uncharacterized repeat protein (TIGR01451 family)
VTRIPLPIRRTALALIMIAATISGAAIVLADPASPVSISDVATPDPVASGAQITHSITIVNNGGAKISNVVMSNQLNGVGGIGVPPQLQIASSRGSCAQSGTLITCNAGDIEGRGTWTLSIRGLVTAANGTVLNNTVSVTGTKSAQNFTTTNTTTTLVNNGGGANAPELSINKTGPTSVVASSPMTYTLTVNNTGTQNATGVRVIDTVPAGLTGIAASGTSLFVCDVVGQTVTCDGGAVNQGSNATITINATAPAALGQITNTAVVDPDNTIAESNELNNTSALVNTQVTDLPEPPALSINITDDPSVITGAGPNDPIVPGALLTYKILATNNAATRADDVVIVLGTQGLEASSVMVNQVVTNGAVGTHNGCTNVSPQAKCTVRSLNPGGTILMTVSGFVVGPSGSFMIGTATVTGNIKNKGVTNTDTELTTIMPQHDLTITKADSPDPVCAASWPGPGYPAGVDYPAGNTCQGGLTYTFVVGNSGLQDVSGVTVRDPLPAGVIFDNAIDVDGAGFVCGYNVPLNVVTCTGGTIPAQSTKTLKFVVVAPPGLGQITNTVTVDPNNAIFEADESNNTFTQTTQIATGIDLTVAKHSNHEANFVATRGTLTYTIKVSNLGTQDATNIHVRDTLPADTIFRDAVSDPLHGFSCSQSGGSVECINGRIQGTQSMNYPNLAGMNVDVATITIRVFATAYEQPAMHNEVRVDPLNQIGEANENNNLAVQNTQVKSGGFTSSAFNELTISKIQQSPDPLNTARNAVVTYIIKVGNDGTDPVVGVKLRDTLPAGARYIEATGTNSFLCQQQLVGFIDCVGGQIAANTPTAAGATITVKAFAPDTPGTYTNQVEVDPDHTIAEGDEFNNNASAQTVVKNAGAGSFHELSVTKTQTSPLPKNDTARNAIVTYAIVVTNSGSDAVNGVVVRDKLPAGARYIQASGTSQFLCTEAQTGIVDCVNGQVAGAGGTATITLKMFAPDTPGIYVNQVNVDPDNAIPEGDEFNNQALEETTVVNGGQGAFNDLTIVKTGSDTAAPRGPISYNLAVSNTGSNAAQNVSVRDVLPAGTEFVSAQDAAPGTGAFLCSHAGDIINCTGGTLNPGVPRNISIQVKAPNAQLTLTNQAFIDPDNDIPEGDEENNASTKNTAVVSSMNLKLTKSGPTQSSQGQTGKYTVTVTNVPTGTGETAFDVTMRDTLPIGLIPLSVANNGNFQCTVAENPINEVICLGDLEPGEGKKVEFVIDVFMTGEGSRSLDNEACIDTENKYEESAPEGESDNCHTASSSTVDPPKRSPNLFVSKSASTSSVTPGQDLTYTVLVQNNGDAKAMGPITLTDNLPAAVTFQNANGTNGWTCALSSGDVVCNEPGGDGLEPGASATITINVKVNDDASLSFTNAVSIGVGQGDPVDPDVEDEKAEHLGDNSATATSSVGGTGIELAIGSIIDTPDPVNRSKQLKWTIVALNSGTLTADDAVVRITLPPVGVSVIGAEGSNGFNCPAPVAGIINCMGDLPGGGDTIITITAVVQPGAPDDLNLTAKIDPDDMVTEGDEGNNQQTEVTTVSGDTCTASPCIDLVAALLHAQPDPVAASGTVTFHYTFVNIGDTTTALLPHGFLMFADVAGAHTSFLREVSNPAITCVNNAGMTPGANIFSDCSGELGPGEGVTITITVNGVSGATITATGTADPDQTIVEFIEGFVAPGNNRLVKTVTINP